MTSTRLWRPAVFTENKFGCGAQPRGFIRPSLGHSYWRIFVKTMENCCQFVIQYITLSKTDTFETRTNIRLIGSRTKGGEKAKERLLVSVLWTCPLRKSQLTNRPQFSLVFTLIDDRYDVIKVEPRAVGEWFHCKVLNILWRHFYSL